MPLPFVSRTHMRDKLDELAQIADRRWREAQQAAERRSEELHEANEKIGVLRDDLAAARERAIAAERRAAEAEARAAATIADARQAMADALAMSKLASAALFGTMVAPEGTPESPSVAEADRAAAQRIRDSEQSKRLAER